jgi:hypothetical protein
MNNGITQDPFEVLKLCANTKSLKERKDILSQNDTPALRNVLLYAKSPLMYYNVHDYQFEEPMEHQEGFDYQFNNVFIALDYINKAGGMTNKNKADILSKIKIASSNLNTQQQQVFRYLLEKDFGFKLELFSINEVFKDLIPVLRLPKFDYVQEYDGVFPVIVEPMYNGDIFTIVIRDGKVIKFDENSSPVVGEFKYDKELKNTFANNVALFCISTGTVNSKLVIYDLLSVMELRNGVIVGNKLTKHEKLNSILTTSSNKHTKTTSPVIVYSKKEFDKLKPKLISKDGKLLGFLLRSNCGVVKKFTVELI